MLETQRIQPFVPVGWMKYESMPRLKAGKKQSQQPTGMTLFPPAG